MTTDEIRIVQALAGCRFAPATSPKRLVRQLEGRDRAKPLTDNQRAFLWAVAWSWRRQLPRDLVDLAAEYSGCVGVRGRQICAERYREHIARVAAARATQAPAAATVAPIPALVDDRQEALFG